MERRPVTSSYHSSKILDLINLHFRTMNETYGLSLCSWVQLCTGKSCMSMFNFFLPYLQGHVLLRPRNFATMAT